MTLQEFKAWFDGFTESMDRLPNKKQWERIKERIGQIDGVVTTQHIFVNRYWPSYPYYPTWGTVTIPLSGTGTYSANTAMYALGQNDSSLTQ